MDMASMGGGSRRIYGVVIGIVVDHKHPEGEYRVKVKFPWIRDSADAGDDADFESTWARISTIMGGPGRGWWCLPEVGDEVLVMFEHGDVRRPFVVGSLWNGKDKAPVEGQAKGPAVSTDPLGVDLKIDATCVDTTNHLKRESGDKTNTARFFYSRSGHLLLFDDSKDAKEEKIVLKTARGHTIVLNDKDGNESIAIYDSTGEEYIVLDEKNKKIIMETKNGSIDVFCKKGTFNLEAKNITTKAETTIEHKSGTSTKHESGSTYDIKAGGDCTVKGGPNINLN
jgi:uncharacterized protein involved in type VI secretion and phage assembly